MNDNGKTWEKIVAQIPRPWECFAILCSFTFGTGIIQITHRANLITSAIACARLGIAVGKILIACFPGPILRKKANNLRGLINELPPSLERKSLLHRLDLEVVLWKESISTDDEFKSQLNKLINDFKGSVGREQDTKA